MFSAAVIERAKLVATSGKWAGMGYGTPTGEPCSRCGMETIVKVSKKTLKGSQSCTRCSSALSAKWNKANKARYTRHRRAWERRNPTARAEHHQEHKKRAPWHVLAVAANRRSNQIGVPCDLDGDYVRSIVTKDCPCCGVEMDYEKRRGNPAGAQLDRHVPELGYVKGNVSFLCSRCNNHKSDMGVEDVERLLTYLKKLSA